MHVVKRFEFDAAHRLYPYEGKCSNIHGHRYVVEVCVSALVLNAQEMVIDFGTLGILVGDWIDAKFDHALILGKGDPLLKVLPDDLRVLVMGGSPTAETMAAFMFDKLQPMFAIRSFDLALRYVRLYETPNSYVEAWG